METLNQFGVDMVYLNFTDYTVNSLDGWSISGGNPASGEWVEWGRTLQGDPLMGKGYYMNRGKKSTNVCTWDIRPRGLHVQFNPSTMLHPWNLNSSFEHVVGHIEKDMQRYGIDLDVNSGTVNRIDLTKQVSMPSPFGAYRPALASLHGARMSKVEHAGGMEWGNRARQIVAYDKGQQMKVKKGVFPTVSNLLRIESKYTERKAVADGRGGVGVSCFGELVSMDTQSLHDRYRHTLSTTLFNAGGEQLRFDFAKEIQVMEQLAEQQSRNWVKTFIALKGIDSVVTMWGGIDPFLEQVRQVGGFSERTIRRMANDLRGLQNIKGQIDAEQGQESMSATLEFLKKTFIA